MADTVKFDWNPLTNEPDMVEGGGPAPVIEHQEIITNGVHGVYNSQNNTNTTNIFGPCNTAANQAAKTVRLLSAQNITLTPGLTVRVWFANANTADNPTLAVNGGWGLYIYVNGTQITTGDNKGLLCGVCEFVLADGKWHLIGSQPKIDPALMTNVTYAELVALRSNAGLKPGEYYRITDYACTTTQRYTRSAGNAFDIIVRADAVNKLNENAFATHHSGDTYFADCNLAAWSLKYTLDNDTSRFQWADDTNGKGVVYYMKDEFNNECPYDFKNIQFQRWAVKRLDNPAGNALVVAGEDNNFGFYYGIKTLDANTVPLDAVLTDEHYGWFYTFALKDLETGDWHDYTVAVYSFILNNENVQMCCRDNHISLAVDEYNGNNGNMTQVLNNIVIFNCCTDLSYGDETLQDDYSYCNGNHFASDCINNTFGSNCSGNTFGSNCSGNTFGNGCSSNTFGNDCFNNTFGNGCYSNTFGNNCYSNTIGNCYNNTFGNNCYSNTGNYIQDNTFGNYCYSNTFGSNCSGNTFGNGCSSNTFGNDCFNNTFGNGCYSNTFGNNCYSNTIGNNCYSNTIGNNVRYLTVFEGVIYCNVVSPTVENRYIQYTQILNGVHGRDSQNLLTISFVAGANYTQVACFNSSGALKIYCPADNVQ